MEIKKIRNGYYEVGRFRISRTYYKYPGNCHWTWSVYDTDSCEVIDYKNSLKAALRIVEQRQSEA